MVMRDLLDKWHDAIMDALFGPRVVDKKELRKKFNLWLGNDFDAQYKETPAMTRRWLFCWHGIESPTDCFDCACCLSDVEHCSCGCICHERITQIVDFFWKEGYRK
jgi:hypothetical protein